MNYDNLTAEDLELLAAAQQLAEMSKEAGIDVNSLTDDQVIALVKVATEGADESEQVDRTSAEPDKGEGKVEKKVEEETEEMKAGANQRLADEDMVRIAQADFTGRVIARAMMDELKLAGFESQQQVKTASAGAPVMKSINHAVANWIREPTRDRMNKVAAVHFAFEKALREQA